MKILVIGSGAREHAIGWRLRLCDSVQEVLFAPGNPGTEKIGRNLAISVENFPELIRVAKEEAVDLTVVGPELPLTLGIVDQFEQAGLAIFGPSKAAAQLEGSKAFAKEIMSAAGVPTAQHETFTTAPEVLDYVKPRSFPTVLKADGLASGKGVVVCQSLEEAERASRFIFGDLKAEKCVVEDFLEGVEASFIVMTDGTRVIPFPASHDYKRLRDGDQGPNTGGMGTVSPTPHLSCEQEKWVIEHVIHPTLKTLRARNIPFRGFLYAGLMVSKAGDIRVVEFNARLGDPETQVLMRRIGTEFADCLLALASKRETLPSLSVGEDAAVCVVLAAEGYPESPRFGDAISGIERAEAQSDCVVFQAGTKRDGEGKLYTQGGRVLSVTSTGKDVALARLKAFQSCRLIEFRGAQFRRDIAEGETDSPFVELQEARVVR
ncbi:MAG: phosphoribosylamine--glycine ligase [Bdellovibrionales bacterium]|nr:phosphoribosylamine--glycine ligase [Bdellovibrionales bacterium]